MTKWRKSSRSGSASGEMACVEVADLAPGIVGLRDSKNSAGPHLSVSADVFGRLLRQIKDN
jgi:Domain of unknown function (DUF397)